VTGVDGSDARGLFFVMRAQVVLLKEDVYPANGTCRPSNRPPNAEVETRLNVYILCILLSYISHWVLHNEETHCLRSSRNKISGGRDRDHHSGPRPN